MFAHVNGIQVYYEDHGQGNPVLMVHGLADSHALWRHQVRVLARRYRTRLRGMETHLHPGVSHLLPVEAADEFNRILRAFLDRIYATCRGEPSAGGAVGAVDIPPRGLRPFPRPGH